MRADPHRARAFRFGWLPALVAPALLGGLSTIGPAKPPPYVAEGAKFSNQALSDAIANEDLPAFATHFSVPIIFIQGSDDLLTTTSVVKDYFNRIVAQLRSLGIVH